jgi:hypothetical protein
MRGRSRKNLPARRVESDKIEVVVFDGGEDLITPALGVAPGRLLASYNYEPSPNQGYSRTGNFEAFDGRAKPHQSTYHSLRFDQGSVEFTHNDVVTGSVSGATGKVMVVEVLGFTNGTYPFWVGDVVTNSTATATGEVVWIEKQSGSINGQDLSGNLYLKSTSGTFTGGDVITASVGKAVASGQQTNPMLESGSWGGGDAAGSVYLYGVQNGTFVDGEGLEYSPGNNHAIADGDSIEAGALEESMHRASIMYAISATRDDITAIPGSGPVRGIVSIDGEVFAFRDNVGGTALGLYKATPSGWSAVSLPAYIDFDQGSAEWTVGETVVGGTSASVGVVDAVIVKSGISGSGNQAGRLYINTVVGTFQNNEALVGSVSGVATADGINETLTLNPGGYVESVVHNFGAGVGTKKIYGVDGINDGWEFDGTNFYTYPTTFGVAPDHIISHKDYLFMSFASSVGHSGLGNPRDWSAIVGAVEIGTGDDVTGFAHSVGDVLTIFNRSATYLLYGDVSTEWEKRLHSRDSGAIERSIQEVGGIIYMDDPGLTKLSATQDFGDFQESTISKDIEPYLRSQRKKIISSMRVKDKNQYRIFFSDGSGIHARVDRDKPAYTRVTYGNKPVRCTLSTVDEEGTEILFFGCDDGFVYQLDVGRKADRGVVEAYLRYPFWNMKSPTTQKRFLQTTLQINAPEVISLDFTAEFDYGSSDIERGRTTEFTVDGGGGFWDFSTYGNFVWSAQTTGEAIAYLQGSGVNMGLLVHHISGHEQNHTIESAIVRYVPRGTKR